MKYPLYKPYLTENAHKYVNDCLQSTWISSKGEYIQRFEDRFKAYTGRKHAISCSNGTTALHLALLALGIKKGDEVIVPTFTYIATVNAISYVGATPVFADCYMDTYAIKTEDVKRLITKKTKAVILVHLYGSVSVSESLINMLRKHKIKIIEDCAESLGSKYSGTYSDIATYSFFGNKTITTGEGGMLTTDSKKLSDKITKLKGQGLSGKKEYHHDIIGYNYRMTNIQAAIGLSQLERVWLIIGHKKNIHEQYKKHLGHLVKFQSIDKDSIAWLTVIELKNKAQRDGLRKHLAKYNIETRPAFPPIHTMPMYKTKKRYPIAERIANNGVCLPSYPDLSPADTLFISNLIKNYVKSSKP